MGKSEEIITKLNEVKGHICKDISNNKNSQLHLFLETDLLNKLRKEAKEQGVSVSSLCRQKLRNSYNLENIKKSLDELNKKLDRLDSIN
jgi:hypothetical protein